MSSLIRVYQGATVVFNLTMLKVYNRSGRGGELWDNDFCLDDPLLDDNEDPQHLIARLHWFVHPSNSGPLIMVHYGTTQVLLAPILFAIDDIQGRSITIKFKDYSNRSTRNEGGVLQENNQGIERLFRLTFSKVFEAAAFKAVYNTFRDAYFEPHLFAEDNGVEADAIRHAPPAPIARHDVVNSSDAESESVDNDV